MSLKISILTLISFLFAISCTPIKASAVTDGSEAPSNITESALSQVGASTTATEGAAVPGMEAVEGLDEDLQNMDFLDPQEAETHPETACTFSAARSVCTSNVDSINWNGCTVGGATLTGGWIETWNSGFCADGTKPGALSANGQSVTRTSPTGEIITLASGATITTDTVAHTAYDLTAIGSGVSVSYTGGTRSITIAGIHSIMKGPHGTTWFDHSLTSAGLSVTGTRLAQDRIVTGTMTLYHNLALLTAVHTFNGATWGDNTCCYPTSGNISSVLTGSVTGTVTLAFSSTCGHATFTNTSAVDTAVTLTQCR